jgi:serine/threonine protein kinase
MEKSLEKSVNSEQNINTEDVPYKHKLQQGLKLDMNLITHVVDKFPKSSDISTHEKSTYPVFYTPVNPRTSERRSVMDKMRASAKQSIIGSLMSNSGCSSRTSITDDSTSDSKTEVSKEENGDSALINSPWRKKRGSYRSMDSFSIGKINAGNQSSISKIRPELVSMIYEEDCRHILDSPPKMPNFDYKKTSSTDKIFFALNNDGSELLKELEVENDPDIKVIDGNFSKFYEEKETLGQGTTGIVKRCQKVGDEANDYAVKIVSYKGEMELLKMIVREFDKMKRLDHKNIVKVFELYIDTLKFKAYVIMELVEGKEMLEVIEKAGPLSEMKAAGIFRQLLLALVYLHGRGVCHRDLKPSNILISDDVQIVKITDFNVSKFCDDEEQIKKYSMLKADNYKMWTNTGTKSFLAPEVLDGEYTEACDIWSAGVTLFIMLSGTHPFDSEYLNDQIELIKEAKFDLEDGIWKSVSEEAKILIRCCLKKDFKERITPSQAIISRWIAKYLSGQTTTQQEEEYTIFRGERHSSFNELALVTNYTKKFKLNYGDIGGSPGIRRVVKPVYKKRNTFFLSQSAKSELPELQSELPESQSDLPESQPQ